MKRLLVILALVVVSVGGIWVTWYARYRAVTPPAPIEPAPPPLTLSAAYRAVQGDPRSPTHEVWKQLHPVEVPMLFQVLVIPWGKSDKGPVEARAFHDGKRVYFRLEWSDPSENRGGPRVEDLADATAVMFPLQAEQTASLMMGFLGRVNIWHWKANWDQEVWAKPPQEPSYADFYPLEEDPTFYAARAVGNLRAVPHRATPVEDILSEGPGSIAAKEKQTVQGRGSWSNGRWAVVLERELHTAEAVDFQFAPGERTRMAFAVWDGARGEKGSRKSISEWVWLELETGPTETAQTTREAQR